MSAESNEGDARLPRCATLIRMNTPRSTEPGLPPRRGLVALIAAYATVSALWIVLSDRMATWLAPDPAWLAWVQTFKGWFFVAVTAALLYLVLRRMQLARAAAQARETAALRQQAQAAQLLQAVVDHSSDAIFVKDREGRYLLFNREAARVTGRDAFSVLGRDDDAVFPAEQAAIVRANDEQVMMQARAQTFEEEVDTADGRVVFQATKGPLMSPEGIVGMFGISRNVTAMVQARRALADRELRYRTLFESNPQPVWLFDLATQRFLDVNAAAVAQYGYSREEFLSMTLADIRPPEHRAALEQDLAERRPGVPYGPSMSGPWVHRRKDGRLIEVEISSNDFEVDGRHARLVLALDITARRAAEAALRRTQLDLSALARQLLTQERETTTRLAHALHDQLGQTLAGARLQLDLAIARSSQAQAGCDERLQRVSTLLDAAVADVRALLVGLRPPLLRERGLAAALDNELQRRLCTDAEAELHLNASSAASAARWPDDVEYAVFMIAREALANALHHAHAQSITLKLEGDGASLHFSLCDDGCGIAEAAREARPGHLGLVGMRERAVAIGARLDVRRLSEGGTEVRLDWECQQP